MKLIKCKNCKKTPPRGFEFCSNDCIDEFFYKRSLKLNNKLLENIKKENITPTQFVTLKYLEENGSLKVFK